MIGALYIRVSTEEQVEYSPDAQKRSLLDYANRNNIEIPQEYIYIDEGVSGRSTKKRYAFIRMITAAKQRPKPFDVILVHKFDRFARNREDSIVYKSLLKKEYHIPVISITEQLEEDKFSIILEAMLEAMAEYYSLNLSEEVMKGMTERAIRGLYQSTPPLGYEFSPDGLLTIIEHEAMLVQEIFKRFTKYNQSPYLIAKTLNTVGFRTKHNNLLTRRSVLYILQNPIYAGKIYWNRFHQATHRIKPKKEWIITDGKHPPIIPADIFALAKEKIHIAYTKKQVTQRTSHKHLFSGFIKCSECSASLSPTKRNYVDNQSYITFQCNNYNKGKCQTSHSIHEEQIYTCFLNALHQLSLDTEEAYRSIVDTLDSHISLENKKRIQQKQKRLLDAYLNGIHTLEEYQTIKLSLDQELDQMKKSIFQLNTYSCESFTQLYELFLTNHITPLQKRNILEAILDRIVYAKEEQMLKIYFKEFIPFSYKGDPMGQ